MKIKFRIFKKRHKSISFNTKDCETIIRHWGWFKFDVVKLFNPNPLNQTDNETDSSTMVY